MELVTIKFAPALPLQMKNEPGHASYGRMMSMSEEWDKETNFNQILNKKQL